ncbi:hypothetical protein Pyn_36229 [Prunus yedoensis var. nudiflora]|uniref:Uncharacterized protein n=1 Tax=Prunus yedoensis var. nudiflora TaxID=2094558 RepID=A0A314ZIP7_PRUYE|nr:hypothetical protein Pyn_36229 [Prunus yedoensis var. nudiflora]
MLDQLSWMEREELKDVILERLSEECEEDFRLRRALCVDSLMCRLSEECEEDFRLRRPSFRL